MSTYTFRMTPSNTIKQTSLSLRNATTRKIAFILTSQQNISFSLAQFIERFTKLDYSRYSEAFQTMLASEEILRRDWDDAEEDALWADL